MRTVETVRSGVSEGLERLRNCKFSGFYLLYSEMLRFVFVSGR